MGYRDLMVWREAVFLLEDMHALTAGIPERERIRLTDPLMRFAAEVPGRIACGAERNDRREALRQFEGARTAMYAAHSLLVLAEQRGYVDTARLEALERAITVLGKPLDALIGRIRRDVDVLEGGP